MGLHTGEPAVGDEGYLGLDVVRAARLCAAGKGGHILLSETTRALVGNQLPEGVSVPDLGERQLKDFQPEHIFELSVDGRSAGYKSPKAPKPQSRSDDLSARFEQRIQSYVESQLERAFGGTGEPGEPPQAPVLPTRLALSGLGIAFVALALLVLLDRARGGARQARFLSLRMPSTSAVIAKAMPRATITARIGRSSKARPPK